MICCIIFMSVCTLWQGWGNQQWQFTGARIDRVCSHPKEILLKFGLTPEYLYLLSDKRITRLFMVTSRGSGSSEKIAEFRSVDRLDDHGATPATVLCRLSVPDFSVASPKISYMSNKGLICPCSSVRNKGLLMILPLGSFT